VPDSVITLAGPQDRSSVAALVLAGFAAVLASGCCVVPLILAIAGISGAWISRLHSLAPYSQLLIGLAVLLLAVAGWRLFYGFYGFHGFRGEVSVRANCVSDDGGCSTLNGNLRRWFWLVALLTLVPMVVPLVSPLFY